MRGNARRKHGRRSATGAATATAAAAAAASGSALHHVEEPWKPAVLLVQVAHVPGSRPEAWRRETRGILNRLTPENSARLCSRLWSLPVHSEAQLCDMARMVVEKAADEPVFSGTYANMCKAIASKAAATATSDRATATFGELLSSLCAAEFDTLIAQQPDVHCRGEEPTPVARARCRRQALGFVRFAGELYKLQLLSQAVACQAVVRLLDVSTDVSLECLCRFLTTAGQHMDDTTKPAVDDCFARVSAIVADGKASLRLCFLLMDVLDLRQNGWQPRRADRGPTTLAQVRQEAAVEALEKKMALSRLKAPAKRRRSARAVAASDSYGGAASAR